MAITDVSQIGTATNVKIVLNELVVESATAVYFGDPTTNGSYRIVRSGNNLDIQRRETGSWVQKEYTMP